MAVDLEIEWRGLERLERFLRAAPLRISYAASEAVDQLGYIAERRAKALAPARTGRLRSSIRFEKHGPLDGALVSDVPYARFQEFGARPHIIRPRRARALRWFGPEGEPIFRMWARHPGIRPRLFMTQAMEESRRILREVFLQKIDEWLRERGE